MIMSKRSPIHFYSLFLVAYLRLSPVGSFSPSTSCPPPTSATFLRTTTSNASSNLRQSTGPLYYSSHEDDDISKEEEEENKSKSDDNTTEPTWLQKAMGVTPETPAVPSLSTTTVRNGIAGFAVDAELGFVCIFHYPNDEQEDEDDDEGEGSVTDKGDEKFVYAVISPSDRTTLQSAESLCIVQLAGGLDLGAAVFPPDTLAKLVAREIDEDDDDDGNGEYNSATFVEELRSRVRLLAITAIDGDNDINNIERDATTTTTAAAQPPPSNSQRDANIEQSCPTLASAVRNLPGLHDVSHDQVLSAMRLHADSEGNIDRHAFSEVLDTLRRSSVALSVFSPDFLHGVGDGGNVRFRLTASVAEADGSNAPSTLVDFYAPAFEAVGLALRYDVSVTVSEGCVRDSGNGLEGMEDVLERFCFFRPLKELEEDAKIMDGFIPSMFFKETAPDNDDKV